MVEIRLFGSPEIRHNDVRAEPDTRKALAVAARLALTHASVSREVLAALLWPDADETRARAALRRTLTALRSVVGQDVLVTDRQGARLDVERLSIDTVQFEAELKRTEAHGHPPKDVCQQCLPHLERAVDLYQGDFLGGFSVRDAPDFEAWVSDTAMHYRRHATLTLERLAHGRAAAGDYSAAIAAARRWLDLDPIHEPAHRYLMLLHAWAGDRGGALEAYRECVRLLDVELGVSPLEETTELHEAILHEEVPEAPSPRRRIEVGATPASAPSPLLVGRDQEWALLTAQLQEAETTGRVLAVVGEPGVGKTRLLEEFATRGTAGVTLIARAYRGERTIPYGVVAQLVENTLTSPAAEDIRRLPDWVLTTASRLVPAVGEVRPGLSMNGEQPEPTAERRFIDALEQLLAACGQTDGAGLIVVDDAQWLDSASSAFLAYLVRRISRHRLLMTFSFRDGELPADSPLALAATDAELAGRLSRVDLGPLQLEDVARLVHESGSTNDPEDVWHHTGGLPLFVVEQLESDSSPTELADRVRRALAARIADLSELARQVLAAAAVLDGMIDLAVLRQVAGRSEEEEVEALDELLKNRLLREVRDGTSVEFVHAPLREAVYRDASLIRRRLLHRRAAEALGDVSRDDARDAAAAARHLQLAGDDAGAAIASARAGDLAREVFAHAEAAELYRNAIALGHTDPGAMYRSLGDIALATGAYGEAVVAYQTAAARTVDADAALADHRLGEIHRRLGNWDAAEEYFTRSVEHHPSPVALHADWSLLERRRGNLDLAHQLAERARSAAEDGDDKPGLARALDILGILATDANEAIRYLEQSLELAGDDPILRTAALNNLSLVVENAGDPTRALDLAGEALELARRVGDRHRQAALHNRMADLHHAAGDEKASQRALGEAVRLFAEIGSEPGTWEPEVWLLTQW